MTEKAFVDRFMNTLIKLPCIYPIKTESTVVSSDVPSKSKSTPRPSDVGSDGVAEIQVVVKTLSGSQHVIQFDPSNSVYELKCLLESMANVPVEEQRLILKGKALLNEHAFNQYMTDGMREQSSIVIHLVEKPIPST